MHEAISAHMSAKKFYIALYDAPSGMLSFPYWVDEFDPPPGTEPVGKGLTAYVLRHPQPILATEEVDAALRKSGEVELDGTPSQVWLGVPLKVGEQTIGVMAVQDYESVQAKTEKDLLLMEFVSSEVAQAIERTRSAQALRESEERYRDLVENSTDVILTHDLSGRLLSYNPATERLFGAERPQDAIGLHMQDFLVPEMRELFGRYLETITREGKATGFMRVRTLSGEERILAYDNTLKADKTKGTVVRARAQDVTEKFEAEKALKASESRYRALFENNMAGVYRTNAKGAMLECNQAMAGILGYAGPDELKAAGATRLYPDSAERDSYLDSLRRNGRARNLERHLVKKDGTLIKVLLSSTIVPGKSPEEDLIDGTLIDITDREHLAQEQMRVKDLETITTLAAGVAHEVRNPLFAIQVNLAALARKFPLEPDAKQHMEHIVTHVKRLDDLIRNLLELGQALKPEELEETDLRTALQSACLTIGDEYPEVRDRISLEDGGEPLVVRIAQRKIAQAFVNILRNAAQVTPGGSMIRVECAQTAAGSQVQICDGGPGISERVQKTLFQPFVTTRTGQSGLGLALARHYVESHGGTITVQNNDPLPGAVFTVRLPLGK